MVIFVIFFGLFVALATFFFFINDNFSPDKESGESNKFNEESNIKNSLSEIYLNNKINIDSIVNKEDQCQKDDSFDLIGK